MEKLEFLAGFGVRLVLFGRLWYAICESAVGKQHAVCSSLGFCKGGSFLSPPALTLYRRGDKLMVTFSDLIQIGILVIGMIELVLHLIELDRNKRQ